MTAFLCALGAYLIAISLLAIFLTIHDKQRAKQHERRIPERTLMLIGLAGGALAMYLTMRAIRHKTLHRKFMWGLPAEIALQAILACAAVFCHPKLCSLRIAETAASIFRFCLCKTFHTATFISTPEATEIYLPLLRNPAHPPFLPKKQMAW